MKALIIIQDMKQLKEVYGENNSFLGNMSTTLYYTTNDVDTAKYVETRLGNKTEKIVTKSYSQGLIFRKINYTESYVGRPLMRAEEELWMKKKLLYCQLEKILFVGNKLDGMKLMSLRID